MYIMFYENFDANVNTFEEGYELLIQRFGYYDPSEVFFIPAWEYGEF